VTANSGTDVTITWTAPANSAAPLEAYRIWVRHADGTFSEETTHCDGADPAILAALTCTVPLTHLRPSYSLGYDALVQARVQAKNANGWGSLSQVNLAGARIQTEPSQMAAPVMGSATSTTQLEVDFTALATAAERGGAAIDSYHLEWDEGTGTWADVAGQDGAYQLLTTHVITGPPPVAGGTDYRLRVRAHNLHGWGPESEPAVVFATSAPGQPDPVTTAQVSETIEIRWTAPLNNYESLDAYRLTVEAAGGAYLEDLAHCDASTAAVMAELACRIPVATLVAAPYSLPAGALVVAQVQAHNARGWGANSDPNSGGAVIITVPLQMAAPVRDSSATTTSQIKVDWAALSPPEDG
jgi:hypothetical protein